MTSMSESQIVKDPVCGKEVDTLRARAVGIFGGVTYYFCSAECKSKYKDPRQKPRPAPSEPGAPAAKEGPAERPRRNTLENWNVLEGGAEPSRPGYEPEVRYAKSKPKRQTEPEEPKPQTTAPEEDEMVPGSSSKVWLVVLMLFAAAGVVLYFALKR
jgi:YHS domain-containing protein